MRLAVAAVGQLASPVQSCWIASQVMAIRAPLFDLEVLHPIHCLWNHFVTMYKGVESTQPAIASHPAFRNYFARVHSALTDVYTAGIGPTTIGPADLDVCTDRKLDDAQTPKASAQPATPGIQATPGDRNACALSCPGIQATPGNQNSWESTDKLGDENADDCAKPAHASIQCPGIQATPGYPNAWPSLSPAIQATPGQQNAWLCPSPGIQATPGQQNAWGTESREVNDAEVSHSHQDEEKPADTTCQHPLPESQTHQRADCRISGKRSEPKSTVPIDRADDPLTANAKAPGIQATPGYLNAWDVSRPGIQATPGHNNAWLSPLQHCHPSAKDGGEQSHQYVLLGRPAEPTRAEGSTREVQGNLQSLPAATLGQDVEVTRHALTPESPESQKGPQNEGIGHVTSEEGNPPKRVKTHHADLKPQCGGIAAFATGISSCKQSHAAESATTTAGSSPDRGSFSQELLDWANEHDQPTDPKIEERRDHVPKQSRSRKILLRCDFRNTLFKSSALTTHSRALSRLNLTPR